MLLELNGIEVDCIIGERPDERERLQRLRVDVEIRLSNRPAYSDDLKDTVDYVQVVSKVREVLVESKCKLIEHASYLVANAIAKMKLVLRVQVRITKAGSVEHLESASAVFTINKDPQTGRRDLS